MTGIISAYKVAKSTGFIQRDGLADVPFALAQVIELSAAQIAGLSIADATNGGFRLPGHAVTYSILQDSGGSQAVSIHLTSARAVWSGY